MKWMPAFPPMWDPPFYNGQFLEAMRLKSAAGDAKATYSVYRLLRGKNVDPIETFGWLFIAANAKPHPHLARPWPTLRRCTASATLGKRRA